MLLRLLINEKFDGITVNIERLESEDLKKTNHFLDDERTRGIYYTQFEGIECEDLI
jgi:hypothetical protein